MSRMLALWLAMSAPAWACDAVVDAQVHTPQGAQANWDVVWQDGVITGVGPDLDVGGCTVHGRPGMVVTPGFVAVATHLGVVEVELEQATRDDAWDRDPVRAAHQAVLAYNPRSSVVPVTRPGGITSALVHPSGGLISGQVGWVTLTVGHPSDAVVDASVAITVHPAALGSRAAALTRMRELLDDARHHAQGGRYTGLSELSASRLDLEALQPLLSGAQPMVVHADRAADIEAWMTFARDERVRLVIAGGAEAWMLADALAADGVAVLVDPLVYGPGSFDQIHARADNAALLHAAGVPVVLTANETHNARSLRYVAGNAVRGGLPHAAAIAAISQVPAQVFGQVNRGRIAVGAVADLAMWTADPLEVRGRLVGLFLSGEDTPRTSRQTALVEAWRDLPRTWWPDPEQVGSAPVAP